MNRLLLSVTVLVALPTALASQAHKELLDGVRNFTVIDATFGCAGATEASAIPALAAKGYKAIVSLRLDTEVGAAIAESRAAADKAGITYIHLPFDPNAPDMAVADAFITAVTNAANQPVFFHCASANRAAALWMAKRMLVDKWDHAKALEEARLIGLTNASLQKFALDYVAARRK